MVLLRFVPVSRNIHYLSINDKYSQSYKFCLWMHVYTHSMDYVI